jgi:four helix bundle protein
MGTFQSFEEIETWQKARELTREIYKISNQGSFFKDFGLRDQIRKCCVSIMSNIAEGFERSGTGEFVQFLAIAKGSTGEVRAQLYVAVDQGYINEETFKRLFTMTTEIARMIGKLMNYLKKTKIRGTKFKLIT